MVARVQGRSLNDMAAKKTGKAGTKKSSANGSRGANGATKETDEGPTAKAGNPGSLYLGDKIRVERRYVVDGVLTCVSDEGAFNGVQYLGSLEHLLLEDKEGVRMIPLPTISEITVTQAAQRPPERDAFDPSFI
jgi:hypothetical protein